MRCGYTPEALQAARARIAEIVVSLGPLLDYREFIYREHLELPVKL